MTRFEKRRVRTRRRSFVTFMVVGALASALVIFALSGCGGQPTPSTRVETASGPIEGALTEQVVSFKGIPYAAPPVGDLRFRPPQPVAPWTEVRECLDFGPSCPQPTGGIMGFLSVGATDEDCLYLNVWTPTTDPATPLPVMVWIHGGSYITGSGAISFYDGRHLATRGVVLVTVNYRLGPLGFLSHPALSAESPQGVSGNYGLMDQMKALQWVQSNISAFGGDPANVTVFGESAGAMSVWHLMVSPAARGLFQKAIAQSGALLDRGFSVKTTKSLAEAERAGRQLAESLGFTELSDEETVKRLRLVPAEDLIEAETSVDLFQEGLSYAPVVDGVLIPDEPTALFARGDFNAVPLMVGSNRDEGATFTQGVVLTVKEYEDLALQIFGSENAEEVLALFPAETDTEVRGALASMLTELGFAASARLTAQAAAGSGRAAYLYHFTHVPLGNPLGAFHGVEIPYVFGTHGAESGYDHDLSEMMMGYWTRFAATGDPNGEAAPAWPPLTDGTDVFMEFGDTVQTGSRLHPESSGLADRIRGLPE